MAQNKLVEDAFDLCTISLQGRMLKEQAKINIHTLDCINYKYFFTETYPCLQGYQEWTDNMVDAYLNHPGQNCKYYLPVLDSTVLRFWEQTEHEGALVRWYDQEEAQVPPRLQVIKKRIEEEWNFVRHLAEKFIMHNAKCRSFKTENGKFGCLKEFINWNSMTLYNFKIPKKDCMFNE
jgi:hypothetical protein